MSKQSNRKQEGEKRQRKMKIILKKKMHNKMAEIQMYQ